MSGCGYREPVKVVIINTQYVETDARSFKSVVQKLTGKDSNVAAWEQNSVRKTKTEAGTGSCTVIANEVSDHEISKSILVRDMSFKELDRLIREMSPIDELWSNID